MKKDLNEVGTGTFSTILDTFKNVWISAFTSDVDQEINYEKTRNEASNTD